MYNNFLTALPASLPGPGIDPKPVDTMAPLSFFAGQGYYVVGKKIFRNKMYAMQEATRQRLGPLDIKWIFNNDIYDAMDWKVPLGISLNELYRLRAQQLRDKYSYLVLAFSGGGDSTNMLNAFINNNIHLDEVVVHWPRQSTAGRYTPNLSTDATNYSSEWDYLVEPKLKTLATVAPRTKITILDNLHDLAVEEPHENIVELSIRHTWNGIKRYQAWDDLLLARQAQFKNLAFIMGQAPPQITRIKKHVFVLFSEMQTHSYMSDYTHKGLQRNVEFFYFTPDMPEITREQAHAVLAELRANPKSVNNIPQSFIQNNQPEQEPWPRRNRENYRRWLKSVIYPSYNSNLLQVDKMEDAIHAPEWFSWFYKNPHAEEFVQSHFSAITAHQNIIDPSFFIKKKNTVVNYVPLQSKLYHIGNIE